MRGLEDKRAIITGGGTGIGKATALRLAQEGVRVLVNGRRIDKLTETVNEIEAVGGEAIAMACDAAVEDNVIAMIDTCVREFGGLDIFFANAFLGLGEVSLFDTTAEQWDEIMRINLMGSFFAAKHAGLYMKDKGVGSIIFTSSVASLRANGGDAPYSASKAAVNSLAQHLANNLAGTGVRANAVLPGLIETDATKPLVEAARTRGVGHKLGNTCPLKRIGQPEEVAALVAFLASNDGSYVNGQSIAVDGGTTSTHPFGRLN